MFDLFLPAARAALVEAQAEAAQRGAREIHDVHLLLGLLREGSGPVAPLLSDRGATREAVSAALDVMDGPAPAADESDAALATLGIDAPAVREQLTATFGADATDPTPIPYDATAIEAIQAAVAEAREAEARKITTAHTLLGIISSPASRAVGVLAGLGVDVAALAADLRALPTPEG